MIIEYIRPQTIEAALALIGRSSPKTCPMGGGTVLNRPSSERFAVVDLQALGLNQVENTGKTLRVGATTTLQKLIENGEIQTVLREALRGETTYNLRQMASIAGTIVSADGRSRVAGCLLAMDGTLDVESKETGQGQVKMGEVMSLREELLKGKLITAVNIPLNVRLAFECVARTSRDEPIIYAALAKWPSGRTRLALGGYGKAPVLAMDGPESGGLKIAACSAYSRAGDEWASAEYRQEMAGVLAMRCQEQLS